ncbi:unnamed protein product, partial [Phaeothamnion confervicola]
LAGTGVTIGQLVALAAEQQDHFQVEPGDRVEISAYVGRINTSLVDIRIQWFNSAGTFISESVVASTTASSAGAGDLASYTRIGGFVTAPANSKRARLVVYGTSSTTSPTLRVAKPYIGKANAGQTELTPWNMGFEATPGADPTAANIAAGIVGQ